MTRPTTNHHRRDGSLTPISPISPRSVRPRTSSYVPIATEPITIVHFLRVATDLHARVPTSFRRAVPRRRVRRRDPASGISLYSARRSGRGARRARRALEGELLGASVAPGLPSRTTLLRVVTRGAVTAAPRQRAMTPRRARAERASRSSATVSSRRRENRGERWAAHARKSSLASHERGRRARAHRALGARAAAGRRPSRRGARNERPNRCVS